ncbi:MAG: T9SS type A sorting domain-containing protein [Luteibaculaceae bacterium]
MQLVKHVLFVSFLVGGLFFGKAFGQVSTPDFRLFTETDYDIKEIPTFQLPQLDYEALAKEDAVTDPYKDIPVRFAVEQAFEIDFLETAVFEELDNLNVYRLRIEAESATSLGVLFKEYIVSAGARLIAYNQDRTKIIGAFSAVNIKMDGQFLVQPFFDYHIILEFQVPKGELEKNKLIIGSVAQGYRWFDSTEKSFGSSGNCNVNSTCPIGAEWLPQSRSVGLIATANGTRLCTGSMINNTAGASTPYFLTAHHCLPANPTNANNWVIIFNYESPICEGSGVDGITTQTVSGNSIAVSSPGNTGTDMALLLLNETPPATYNLFYSGWNRSSTPATETIGIHHPAGDVKKISFDFDAAVATPYLLQGTPPVTGGRFWRVTNWEVGTTEGGSSGSPLFNQNGEIVGQLYGGFASCTSNTEDYYGRFDLSWPQLQPFLAPSGTAPISLAGTYPLQPALDIAVTSVFSHEGNRCGDSDFTYEAVFVNHGSQPITTFTARLLVNNVPVQTQTITQTLAPSGGFTVFEFNAIPNASFNAGSNQVRVEVLQPNNQTELPGFAWNNNITLSTFYNPGDGNGVTLQLQRDRYGAETTWQFANSSGDIIATGGPYSNVGFFQPLPPLLNYDICLSAGCYVFTIFDSFGDGICCGFGQGFFNVIDNVTGEVLGTGGQFTTQQTVNFCVGQGLNVNELALSDLVKLFPNPSNTQVQVSWNEQFMVKEIWISDIKGRKVKHITNINGLNQFISVENYAKGLYFVELVSNNQRVVKKLLVD